MTRTGTLSLRDHVLRRGPAVSQSAGRRAPSGRDRDEEEQAGALARRAAGRAGRHAALVLAQNLDGRGDSRARSARARSVHATSAAVIWLLLLGLQGRSSGAVVPWLRRRHVRRDVDSQAVDRRPRRDSSPGSYGPSSATASQRSPPTHDLTAGAPAASGRSRTRRGPRCRPKTAVVTRFGRPSLTTKKINRPTDAVTSTIGMGRRLPYGALSTRNRMNIA